MVKGFIVILVVIRKRTISVLDIITHLYYIVKYYFYFFGGAMQVGTLVQIVNAFYPTNRGAIGIIVDVGIHHNGDWKYEVLLPNGYRSWWTESRLEVLCK